MYEYGKLAESKRGLVLYLLYSMFSVLLGLMAATVSIADSKLSTSQSQKLKLESYEFGVFPHMPKNKLFQVYQPIAQNFQQLLQHPVTLLTKNNYHSFQQQLSEQRYDIAFVQPFDYVQAHDHYNYLPLARRSAPLRTIFVVRKDSPLQSLAGLKGKKLQVLSSTAAVSRIGVKTLQQQGFDLDTDIEIQRSKNHFACMQSVLIGDADACVTARRALAHFESVKIKDKLRIIHQATPIPHALFIVHQRVPESIRQQLQKRILSWPNTPGGQALLSNGNLIPFATATDGEYDLLRD